MAFIEKKDPIVLNIMITSKGRDLLSRGELSFDYFGIGDSEIDYNFIKNTSFNPFNSNILRATDKNPQILSFITQNVTGNTLNPIGIVPNLSTTIENHVVPIGFFNENATEFLTDGAHVKQPDIMINSDNVTGGTQLYINQSPSYLGNVNEPSKGDLLLIKWANPILSGNTTGYTININMPTPYLFYKITNIIGGSLATDDLIVEVDRDLPNFTNVSGSTNYSGGIIFYNQINYSGDTECSTSTDTTDDALIAFMQNCQCPTIRFPFWNLSIIYTESIPGIQFLEKQYGQYNTKSLNGFVSYIQNQKPIYKKLGVIHYTNTSVANTYAEGFYGDPNNIDDVGKIPTLDIPYIMWHKSTGATLGIQLKASGHLKYLTGETKSLDTRYYDLTDSNGNIVGKVFYDLKMFVIEDQDLLFALSYKSNRSWTLPNFKAELNAGISVGCPACTLTYDLSSTNPSTINGNDGNLTVSNITGNLGFFEQGQILLEVLSGNTGATGSTQIFFNSISGNTTINNLSAGRFVTKVYDIAATNCIVSGETILVNPTGTTIITNLATTPNRLIADFPIIQNGGVPYDISISGGSVVNSDWFYGDGYIKMIENGVSPDAYTATTNSNADIYMSNMWVKISDPTMMLNTNSLTDTTNYIIYVRDVLPGSNIIDAASGQTLTYYNT